MATKHPSNMLDESGQQRPDMEATIDEVARLEQLVENADNLIGVEWTDTEMKDSLLNDAQKQRMLQSLQASMESAVAVAQDCLRYMRENVMPSLTDSDAVEYLNGAIEAMTVHYREMYKELGEFCTRHNLTQGI